MKQRLEKLETIAEKNGLDLILIQAPDNIEYFTGVQSLGDITALLVYDRRNASTKLYIPLLEYYRYRENTPEAIEVIAVSRTVKPSGIPVVEMEWREIATKLSENREKVGLDASHPGILQSSIAEVLGGKSVNVSESVWNLRMIKDEEEVRAIERAVEITIRGIQAIVVDIRDSITEAELAGVFEYTARKHGAERMAFDPIIAFKPNNAYPHTLPGSRRIGENDLVLVDVGVKYNGRCSDITRMITWGCPKPEERRALEAVVESLNNAIDHVKPGVKACDIYEVAAKTLEKYGLRERFIHGLGHGIGILVHEPPYLRPSSTRVLEPGMVFTIEPGVYVAGEFGVRVEEDVLVTENGAKVLSRKLDRVLEVL